jgi:hypothetical protein
LLQLICFYSQTNEYAVPYAVSTFGIHFHEILAYGSEVSEVYLAAAKINEKTRGSDEKVMLRRIAENQKGFTVVRVRFSNLLSSYYTNYRGIAADILHEFFSVPRGSSGPKNVPHDKLDAVHAMLQLRPGQALLDTTHPVCMEYTPDLSGGIRRVFPPQGNSMCQVFSKHNEPESETAKFLNALGELRIYFSPFAVLCKLMLLFWQAISRIGS